MPRISIIEPMRQQRQAILAIKTTTNVKNLDQTIKEYFQVISDYMKKNGVLKSGVGFVAYHNFDLKEMKIEVGFPVARFISGRGKITAGEISEQDVLFCLYQGAYNKIGSTYDEMNQWVKDHNYQKEELVYEYYYNDGEKDLLITKILIPLIKFK